jgi:drug/metabolite transporter (DMT)-like permease
MPVVVFALIMLAVAINSTAQLLLKAGMQRVGHFEFIPGNIVPIALKIAFNPYIFGGLSCYVMSVIVWMMVLSRTDVGVAYPMGSLGYVLTAMAAWYCFGEVVTVQRLLGIVVIMIGVYLVSRTA